MATVKAVVRESKSNSQGLSLAYIQYGHQQKSTLFSTGIKVNPAHWNARKQLVDSTRQIKKIVANAALIKTLQSEDNVSNAIISKKASEIRQLSKRLMLEDIVPTVYQVKLAYNRQQSGKEILKGDFFELFDEYLEDSKHRLKHGTLKQLRALKNHLLRYQT